MAAFLPGVLAVGVNVDIQRTDGRIHSAIISGINKDNKTVTVEWYERGEAKGKEIELSAVLNLNPSLRPSDSQLDSPISLKVSKSGDPTPSTQPPSQNQPNADRHNETSGGQPAHSTAYKRAAAPETARQVSRLPAPSVAVSSRQNPVGIRGRNATALPSNQSSVPEDSPAHSRVVAPPVTSQIVQPNDVSYTPTVSEAGYSQTDAHEEMDLDDPNQMNSAPDPPEFTHLGDIAQECVTLRDGDWDDSSDVVCPIPDSINGVYTNGRNQQQDSRRTSNRTNGDRTSNHQPVNNRKSSVVKEIERIQLRREERRAAHRVAKEQPDFDPSNPSYEFLMMIREYQDTLDYRPLTSADEIEDHQICVCVRKRPMNKRELAKREIDVLTIPNKQQVLLHEPKTKVDLTKYLENQSFRFDFAFDETADNTLVYRYTAQPLVESIFERGMATCFAYGQTGSGKTHTMGGEFQGRGQQDCSNGIYALAARDVFHLNATKYRNEDLVVDAAFFEIYSGKVFDLLNKKAKLRVLEDGKNQVQVIGLHLQPVHSVDEVLRLLQHGADIRTSGQTSANQHSSRSHAVFQLILKRRTSGKLYGKFSLIDLAGNERGRDTCSSDRITRMEGAEINKSLLALKECIRALGRKGAHLPFRASKLTQVLRDSFIGDRSRTCMIAMISPGISSCEHTLNTLRYADRVKELGPNTGYQNNAQEGNASGDTTYSSSALPSSRVQGQSNRSVARGPIGDNNYPSSQLGGSLQNGRPNAQHTSYFPDGYESNSIPRVIAEESDMNEDDTLAMLRSTNDGEVTEELLNFHEVVTHIERLEEEVCDEHAGVCDFMTKWTSEHFRLQKETKHVAYDAEAYASRLEQLISTQLGALSSLKDKVSVWRKEMRQEEEISSKMHRDRRH